MASRSPTANPRPSVADNDTASRLPSSRSKSKPPNARQVAPASGSPPASSQSPRRTRSSARHAASQADTPASPSSGAASTNTSPAAPPSASQAPASLRQTPIKPSASRKRKARNDDTHSPPPPKPPPELEQPASSTRRPKRQKVQEPAAAETPSQPTATRTSTRTRKGKAAVAMSSPDDPTLPALQDKGPSTSASASSSRKSSRNKRVTRQAQETEPTSMSNRRSKKASSNNQTSSDQDVTMTGTDDNERDSAPPPPPPPPPPAHDPDDSDGRDEDDEDEDDDDDDESHHHYDDDPFGGFGGPPGSGLSSTLRALTGMMSGIASRLREIMSNLRMKEDPSMQMIALQDLSEILLVSNEDNLAGHFSPDSVVKELVALMQPNEITGEENPEMMLLACRCLANLMEALPASAANVVYGGAVPVLCAKLLEIQYIDLAEQSLSTLEKISVDYPTTIVREGGLTACLSYLDFFATGTQRTAVTTAANCCRNIPEDSFPVIKDVMPILLNVLKSSDQKVVEQASLCVTRIIESFKFAASKLEVLVSVDLLRSILRLLLPGTTNLIGANIHTQFLRVLAITARASPRLSAELFKLNVVETLYQILTGVSPPDETEDVASKLDSVVIMQALIHRPREQIIETLNVICELLPGLRHSELSGTALTLGLDLAEPITPSSLGSQRKKSSSEKRLDLLEDCKDQVRRFALILFPTLTDAFSSTVNLSVRQKVLTAQIKMLSNLDKDILIDALKSVPYASFLAAILSQQDHPSLVISAIQITELLLTRLDDIYRYQIYREGVISEIVKLAEHQDMEQKAAETPQSSSDLGLESANSDNDRVEVHSDSEDDHDAEDGENDEDNEDDEENEDDDDEEENGENDHNDDISGSPVSSDGSTMSIDGPPRLFLADLPSMQSRIADLAKKFLETHETEKHGKTMKKKANKILSDLQALASDIEAYYLHRSAKNLATQEGIALFERLAAYFDADVLENATSAELMASGLVRVLEEVFSNPDEALANSARAAFLEVFMGRSVKSKPKTNSADSPATPFSIMTHKLQDLLSRSEHFEVLTVHQNSFDGNRSSAASMLAKQIRLKLVADENSEIPREYRGIMVSIHAIATFKSLDDYLRPRISLHERPRRGGPRDFARALAAMAGLPADRLADRSGYLSSPVPPPPVPPQPSSSRPARHSKAKGSTQAEAPALSDPSSLGREKNTLRRSTRQNPALADDDQAPPPPPGQDNDLQDALECADEKPLSGDDDDDDGDDDIADSSALDAMIGDLEDDMDDEPRPDPSAVSLEVATSGKITAMKDDGTRVPTPAQSGGLGSVPGRSATQAPSAPAQEPSHPAQTPSRPFSYAAAVQSVPSDWHIEFSLDDKVIPNETTIYRAVHSASTNADENASRSIWSAVHSIKFRRVPGPPPTEPIGFSLASDAPASPNGTPASLTNHPTTGSILRLLKILHDLNANLDDIIVENKDALKLNREPLSQFVNTKLTAKLNRQLEEPLIVASSCLPGWTEDLARLYPFVFPFETRHLFLQSTSFGYARSMNRWQNAQQEDTNRRDRRDERPFLGRLQRQKVRISRAKILESALKVMELYGESRSILEVEYFEEVGTGLGPTLEFYSTVSKEFSKKKLKLWREMDSNDSEEFISGPHGLFPRPLATDNAANIDRVLFLFKMLGKFVARSMIDSRIIDLNFNPIFFRIGDAGHGVKPSLGAVKIVDRGLANSLKLIKKFVSAKQEIDQDPSRTAAQKVADTEQIVVDGTTIDDLALDFTLPGYPDIELAPQGTHTPVTIYNVESYLDKVIDMTLGSGVKRQIDAFQTGFSQVFPYSALSAFTPDELVSLYGRVEEDWSLETLMDSIKADHGFNMDSRSVKNLLQTMSEMTPAQRRDFLQFTTGSPKLPIGGFKSLTPMFTVVCKPSEPPYTPDDYLPSVMTCVNYLKLPDYTTIEKMKKQLFTATREGQGAFHLS